MKKAMTILQRSAANGDDCGYAAVVNDLNTSISADIAANSMTGISRAYWYVLAEKNASTTQPVIYSAQNENAVTDDLQNMLNGINSTINEVLYPFGEQVPDRVYIFVVTEED